MRATKERTGGEIVAATCTKTGSARAGLNSSTMEGLMGAAKDAMGGGEAPPHDPAEAEARPSVSIIPDDSGPGAD